MFQALFQRHAHAFKCYQNNRIWLQLLFNNYASERDNVATRLKASLQKIYGHHHELVDRYGVSVCTMKRIYSTGHCFPFLFCLPGLDFLWAVRRVYSRLITVQYREKENRMRSPPKKNFYKWLRKKGHSRKAEDAYPIGTPGPCSSFYWILSCSFTFVALYVLFWLFHLLCCVYMVSMSGLCPWVIFFWFPLESWLPWLLYVVP